MGSVLNNYSKILTIIFIAMLLWWSLLFINQLEDSRHNFLYGVAMGILPIVAAIFGFLNAQKWGLFKSSMGKSILFLSAGLCTWGIGTLIFAYYNIVLSVEVPYPSTADLLYILSWPLWATGMFYLSKATGTKYGLKSSVGKIILFLIPIIVILVSYYLLVVVAREGVLFESFDDSQKLFYDLAYPVGDIIILTIAVLIFGLSFNYFGGRFRVATYLILAGFVLNYISDFSFSYTTTVETFFVGNWVDLLFTATMFTLGLGVSLLDPSILNRNIDTNIINKND